MSATDNRKRKRPRTTERDVLSTTTERNVLSMGGTIIDADDFNIVRWFFPPDGIVDLSRRVEMGWLEIGKEDEGFRVRKIYVHDPVEFPLEPLGQLDALEILTVVTSRIGSWIGELTNLKEFKLLGEKSPGKLPDEIWGLNGLEKLDLRVRGLLSIPSSIGNLTNLKSLALCFSNYWIEEADDTFDLPGSIGDLTNLQSLSLSYRGRVRIPTSITNLTNLQRLGISSEKLSISSSIRELTSLKSLNLQFKAESPRILDFLEISRLTTLEDLTIGIDGITSLPEDIGRLINLRSFKCHSENIKIRNTQIPTSISKDIRSIPSSISNLKNLKSLDLSFTGLSSLPDELGRLTNLEELNLVDLRIDSLPSSISNLTNLKRLNLGSNRLLTSLPRDIGRLSKLEVLDLTRTIGLQSLPASFSYLTNLKSLIIPFPTGALPNEIRALKGLEHFGIPDDNDIYEYGGVRISDQGTTSNYDAKILSKISYDIGQMKNLRCLSICDDAVEHESWGSCFLKANEYETILKTMERCPFLGCLGNRKYEPFQFRMWSKFEVLVDSLNRNKLRCLLSQMRTRIFSQKFPPSLWPCILYQAPRIFSSCTKSCPQCSPALNKGYESDVIFNILVAEGATHILSKRR